MHLLKIAPWQDQEMEIFYEEVDQLMRITKKHEINMVLVDLNTKVEEGEVQGVVGKYGLGKRNDRCDRYIQFCQEKDLVRLISLQ